MGIFCLHKTPIRVCFNIFVNRVFRTVASTHESLCLKTCIVYYEGQYNNAQPNFKLNTFYEIGCFMWSPNKLELSRNLSQLLNENKFERNQYNGRLFWNHSETKVASDKIIFIFHLVGYHQWSRLNYNKYPMGIEKTNKETKSYHWSTKKIRKQNKN